MFLSRSLLAMGLSLLMGVTAVHAGSLEANIPPSGAQGGEAAILQALKARDAAQARSGLLSAHSNVASIRQSGIAQNSTIIQHGRGNTATTEIQGGEGNRTAQTQIGNRNVSAVSIQNGSNNRIETAQQGNDNNIGLMFKDTDNTSVIYSQVGSGINAAAQEIVIQRNTTTPMQIVISQTAR